MILRRTAQDGESVVAEDDDPCDAPNTPWSRRAPLKWQLSLVTAMMVGVAVFVMTVVAYWTVSTSLASAVDDDLKEKAGSLLQHSFDPTFIFNASEEINTFKNYNPDIRVAYYPPGSMLPFGDLIPIVDEVDVLKGVVEQSVRNSGDERIYARHNDAGATIILAQDMQSTHQLIQSLGLVLLIVGALGVLIAIASGMVVATTGLRPLSRLRRAVDYVARTDDLRPIAVVGHDELAQLTRSFNEMLSALSASRRRQTELVADAGHELKTPLTSLRTNMELLMMVSKGNGPGISEKDRQDLEHDVIAQIEELSQLIGDLVDLAREDGPQQVVEPVDLLECIDTSLERVRRRRPDVTFTLESHPWYLYGDPFALGRAMLNLMDNAAKWSPPDGIVRIHMEQVGDQLLEVTFADSGPGIPEEDREKVFERFYRSIQARSMPGSGLGLAIVSQVIARHAGTITAEESDDGGALMRVTLPGAPDPNEQDLSDFKLSPLR